MFCSWLARFLALATACVGMAYQLPQTGNRADAVGTCNNVVVLSSGQRRGGGVQATVIQPGQAQQLSSILAATRARAGTIGDGSSVADGGASMASNVRVCFI